jgi:hypothetical protein
MPLIGIDTLAVHGLSLQNFLPGNLETPTGIAGSRFNGILPAALLRLSQLAGGVSLVEGSDDPAPVYS